MLQIFQYNELIDYIENINLSEKQKFIAQEILKEIKGEKILRDVGLDYLNLIKKSRNIIRRRSSTYKTCYSNRFCS